VTTVGRLTSGCSGRRYGPALNRGVGQRERRHPLGVQGPKGEQDLPLGESGCAIIMSRILALLEQAWSRTPCLLPGAARGGAGRLAPARTGCR